MVKMRIWIGLLLGLSVTPFAFAVRTILYYENECCRNITEGEFAILYAQGLKLREPAQGWTVQSAAAALSTLGHQPEGGWVLSRFLSEAVMARLLRNSPFYRNPFNTEPFQRSNILITISKARGVLPEESGITQGEFAVLLVRAMNLPPPKAGWSVAAGVEILLKQPVPIRPAAGWKVETVLREAEMFQILANTPFRPTPIDPLKEITPMQAYSLLLGKFEAATEGDFAFFVVQALGVAPPPGGWTRTKAVAYIAKEFGIENGYGWSATAPLCAETFERGLKQIVTRAQKSTPTAGLHRIGDANVLGNPDRSPAMKGGPYEPGLAAEAAFVPGEASAGLPQQTQSDTETFLKEVRRKGMISGDRCAIIPIQSLVLLQNDLRLPDKRGDGPPASVPD